MAASQQHTSDCYFNIDENYFTSTIEISEMYTSREIEEAISECKRRVLGITGLTKEKERLVERIVHLKLRLVQVQEAEIYNDPKKIRVVQGHVFIIQSLVALKLHSTKFHCETCSGVIWGPVQSWSSCSGMNLDVCP